VKTEEIAEARRLYEAATSEIPSTLSDEEIDRLVHERTAAERAFMMQAAPAVLAEVEALAAEVAKLRTIPADWHDQRRRADDLAAELEQRRCGGRELGKTVEFLAELIKGAFVRGAEDPIGALRMLGNHLAEVFESEGGLSPGEFIRVQQALDARESEEEARQREGDERRRVEVSRSLADFAHGQRPLAEHERAFQDGA
jgi:hypothetical protein